MSVQRRSRRAPLAMNPLDALAEERIRQAQQEGVLKENAAERSKLIGKLGILLTRAGALRSTRAMDDNYYQKIAEKLSQRQGQQR